MTHLIGFAGLLALIVGWFGVAMLPAILEVLAPQFAISIRNTLLHEAQNRFVPYQYIRSLDRDDIVDGLFRGIGALTQWGHRVLAATQTGLVRSYVAAIAWGAVIILGLAVLL